METKKFFWFLASRHWIEVMQGTVIKGTVMQAWKSAYMFVFI